MRLETILLDVLLFVHHELLQSFSRRYLHITLELVSGTSRVHLTRQEVDIAIRVSKQLDDTLVGMRALHKNQAIR